MDHCPWIAAANLLLVALDVQDKPTKRLESRRFLASVAVCALATGHGTGRAVGGLCVVVYHCLLIFGSTGTVVAVVELCLVVVGVVLSVVASAYAAVIVLCGLAFFDISHACLYRFAPHLERQCVLGFPGGPQ